MAELINLNGEILTAAPPAIDGARPSWSQAEGIFETMRVSEGHILHAAHHFKRLLNGVEALRISIPAGWNASWLTEQVLELCRKNGHEKAARTRLVVYREDNLPDPGTGEGLQFQIESWSLNNEYIFDGQGLTIGIYPHAVRQANEVSPYKTTGYFPYYHAAAYAKEQQMDDCLLLNTSRRICDSSISNVFWIKDAVIFTPPISEGCIDGAMRNYLLEKMPSAGFTTREEKLSIAALASADEVFLTNVIRGMRPVSQFQQTLYSTSISKEIFNKLVTPLIKG